MRCGYTAFGSGVSTEIDIINEDDVFDFGYTAFGSGVSTEIGGLRGFGGLRFGWYTAFGSGVSTEMERPERDA